MTAWVAWLVHRAELAVADLRLRGKVLALVCTPVGVRSRARGLEPDIAARERMEAQLRVTEGLLGGLNRILEMVALDMPLSAVLEALVDLIDTRIPGSRGSILRTEADGKSLRCAAKGRLPGEYCKATDGIPIGPGMGCCGTAAYRRETVIVEDIATDLLCQQFMALGASHELGSCWSTPIEDGSGRVLGAFAVYGIAPHRPSEEEREIVRQAAHLARIAFERHEALGKLRSQADRFRALIENVSDAVSIVEADGTIRYETPAVTGLLGYGLAERLGQSSFAFMHPEEVEAARRHYEQYVVHTPGLHPPVERRFRAKDGRWHTIEFVVNNLLSDPALNGLVVTARDVSERRAAQMAMIASEQRYRELFENANEIIYTHDLAGRFTSLNKAAERALGYPRAEALGKRVWDVVAPEYREKVSQMISAKIGGEAATQYEIEVVNHSGAHVQLEVSSRLIFENGRPVGVQGIARNVTERRELEHQLRQAQKMDAIGRLAGGVAHDFNNLLTVITGYTQWIIDELEPDSPLRESASETLLAANRAAGLTSQLLAFSRHEVIQPAEVDLNEVVANLDRMLRRIIGEDIELVTTMSPNLGWVRVDPGQIGQVVTNLVVNAREAMPEGGSLAIETANVELDQQYCRAHPECQQGSYVMLAVSDSGGGMDPATKARVFEPFFTTKDSGTGLGLATVYGIVKQSGGFIGVYSEIGAGTVFKVYLPRIPEPQARPARPSSTGTSVRGNETILLVEDENGVRRMVREMLQRQGYRIIEAADGGTAERLLSESAGPVHLLLSDVVMPEISGHVLAARLQAMRSDMKVLFMSGYTDDAIFHRKMLMPGSAFLQKPFTPDALAAKVREVLDSK
jgi:PAS domain S-box-containing protein